MCICVPSTHTHTHTQENTMSNYQSSASETYNNAISQVEMTFESIDWLYEEGQIDWDCQQLADGSDWFLSDLDSTYLYLLNILGETFGMLQLEAKIKSLKDDLSKQFTLPTN